MSTKDLSLNFIDLFSGAGGFSCGLELAGHTCLLGVDVDRYAMETFAHNHKKAQVHCGDIGQLTKAKLNKLLDNRPVHLVIGGPPCQGFSTVGPGNPNDIRNKLFLEFVRIVKVLRPYYVMIENVTGLLAKKNEKTLKAIFKQFSVLGYHLDVKVMAAHEYNVPERRRRTIILGSRINERVRFPLEMKGPTKTVGEALADLRSKSGEIYNHDLTTAQIKDPIDFKRIKKVPEGRGVRYKKDELMFFPPNLRLGVDWAHMPEGRFRQAKFKRLDRSLPSPTIMTHRHTYYHPTEPRFLTAREAAALQSFPNDFVFKGPLSAQWRQIGNAVPPEMARALGLAIKDMYKEFLVAAQKKKKSRMTSKTLIHETIKDIRKKAFVYKDPKGKSKPVAVDSVTA